MDLRRESMQNFRGQFLERHKIPRDSRGMKGSIGSQDLSYIIPKSGKLVHVDRS